MLVSFQRRIGVSDFCDEIFGFTAVEKRTRTKDDRVWSAISARSYIAVMLCHCYIVVTVCTLSK